MTFFGNNPEPWRAIDGNPATGGYLNITDAVGSQSTVVIFPDIDAGKTVTSFKFSADVRIGNGTSARPADGFSISYARKGDPVIETGSGFAGGPPEAGTTTGIVVSFDTWAGNALPDGPDIEGIIVRVDNKTVLKQSMPTRHGACDDVTSLQTGPRSTDFPGEIFGLCWQKVEVELDQDAKLTVKYKGKTLLDKFQTTFFPSPGSLVLAGRTGGANEIHHIDNIVIETVASDDNQKPTVPGNLKATPVHARRIRLSWDASTDNSGKVAYEIERDGAVVAATVIGTTFSDAVKPNTSYSYKVRAVDPNLNKSDATPAVSVKSPEEKLEFTQGVMKFEAYTGIGGVAIDALLADPKYPDAPDVIRVVPGYEGPTGFGDNYGARVSGFITPTETASYVFVMSADDAGELWLSTDDKPANKALIATEPTWNGARAWSSNDRRPGCPDFCENVSGPIRLQAGRRYYTELIYKEGGGGDNGAVTMVKEGQPRPANGTPPLGGNLIGAFVDVNAGPPSITQGLKGATVKAGGTASMSVKAIGTPPFTYKWSFQKLGTTDSKAIAGATTDTLSLAGIGADGVGLYSVEVSNEEGSSSSGPVMVTLEGTLFIEAEDFNYEGGKFVSGKAIGMTGAYAGGDFFDLGSDADAGIDWNAPGGNAGQPYRTTTGVAAGKRNSHSPGIPRGGFDVAVNHVVGWNDDGDWYNYTRQFPEPARDYQVIGRLSSGGGAINGELSEVTAGAKTPNQTLKKIGNFKPGRATAGWDSFEWFPMTDDTGKPATVSLGGERTLRFSVLPGNLDVDYFMFIPAVTTAAAPKFSGVRRDGNNIVVEWSGGGTLQSADDITGPWTDVAGATSPRSIAIAGQRKFWRLKQ